MWAEIYYFCHNCISCLISIGGLHITRAMTQNPPADKPNEIINSDFFYTKPREGDELYVLILKEKVY